ncbi:MAG TPA: DUF58 domain-containing protein [Holophaga sp.]|nr:DUF58 domain-containing protein [Holophaga sp.]
MLLWNDKHLRLSLTRLGLEFLLAMLLVGGFAVNTGNNLLYLVFSLMFGLFLVSGWESRGAIRDLAVERIEEGRFFARVRSGLRVRFLDRARGRVRALEVSLDMDGARVERGFYPGGHRTPADARAGDEAIGVTLHIQPERRGACRVRGLEIRTRYPFGFLEKAWRFTLDQELLVFPHPRNIILHQDMKGEERRPVPAPGISSPESARPFRQGDPPSRVHWKRTAQRGAPWVRTFEGEQASGLRLSLDLRAWSPGLEFERELERLSGAILQARLRRQSVHLELTDAEGRHHHCEDPPSCWRALALASPAKEGYPAPLPAIS